MTKPKNKLLLRNGQTLDGLVREYFPKAGNSLIDFILWNKTGFPCFWSKDSPEDCLRKQLDRYRRAVSLNRDVCYCCGKIRFKKEMNGLGFCKRGTAQIQIARKDGVR